MAKQKEIILEKEHVENIEKVFKDCEDKEAIKYGVKLMMMNYIEKEKKKSDDNCPTGLIVLSVIVIMSLVIGLFFGHILTVTFPPTEYTNVKRALEICYHKKNSLNTELILSKEKKEITNPQNEITKYILTKLKNNMGIYNSYIDKMTYSLDLEDATQELIQKNVKKRLYKHQFIELDGEVWKIKKGYNDPPLLLLEDLNNNIK